MDGLEHVRGAAGRGLGRTGVGRGCAGVRGGSTQTGFGSVGRQGWMVGIVRVCGWAVR